MRWRMKAAAVAVTVAFAAGSALVVKAIDRPAAEAPIPLPDYTVLSPPANGLGAFVAIAAVDKLDAMKKAIPEACPTQRDQCLIAFIAQEEWNRWHHLPRDTAFFMSKPMASWHSRDGWLSNWDCRQLGPTEAPRSAHCDPGMREAYDALREIQNYRVWAKDCGWPPHHDQDLSEVLAFAEARGDGPEFRKYLHDTAGPSRHDLGCQFRDRYAEDSAAAVAAWRDAVRRIGK